ncbi:hypothetical protein FHT44_005152 [Mycolicibacterium sp. BK634]|uniref:hypothetical protein n=1 Tax=Mycolicibacterium sp. BK634 TaxID=2587099 RepID=UPI001609FE4D|nr:hypothetical protein [Mycolicibacterium sp. BK634]MBB3752640.1 hypothetical protein [Mycolicibacterium sp. BK634]
MSRKRQARIKLADDGTYCVGMSNGRIAQVPASSDDHAVITGLLGRLETMAVPSPQKLARIAADEDFKKARAANHAARLERVHRSGPAAVARKESPGKRQWEMLQLGKRIGRMG